ncbi:bacterial regulatory helix-turn-helix protein, l ysR family protein [Mycolicibacterium canariasense]|uniref:Bacterial regulatory helix-turn-helix protein, l ysR family protein n=1 Tax=Mycolicibacterium canariasense TaxID=228230 RepID=A0A100WHD0_MYCCR|nr:LysR family transcriptional regulator [Mycolicibacterium canariasense]GAS98549.1 bacterial regulatory helix-turn-helix protein, l ysR family protein [Mycolicibacterium canariasense]
MQICTAKTGAVESADNLRYLLEVTRSGSPQDAARRLGVDRTTVSRRIASLERASGDRLFDRSGGAWQLTDAGRRTLPHAEAIDAAVVSAFHDSERHQGLRGQLRIVASDGFGAYLLTPGLRPLIDEHPDLEIAVVTATAHGVLTMRDFDLAITLEEPSPHAGAVRPLADYELGLYAASAYVGDHAEVRSLGDLASHVVVWYVEALLYVAPLRFLGGLLPGIRARVQTTNITGHHHAVRAGLGIAPLPTYIGDADDTLTRLLPTEFAVTRRYWEVVPREISRQGRVRAVRALLDDLVLTHPQLRPPRRRSTPDEAGRK